MIYTLKGISDIVVKGDLSVKNLGHINHEILNSLFMTITNANFDDEAFVREINKMLVLRNELREKVTVNNLHDSAS